MYKLLSTKPFDKRYKKLIKRNSELADRFISVFKKLMDDPFDISLETHKVNSRKYGETFSSSITGDIRVIWVFDKEKTLIIILLDIGGHSGSKKAYQ